MCVGAGRKPFSLVSLHRTIAYLNCTKSMCRPAVNCWSRCPIFPRYLILAQNAWATSPLINFTTTTAFHQHKKTSTWEQQLTDGGECDGDHVRFNTDPGTHVVPPFMPWSLPALLQKKVEEEGR